MVEYRLERKGILRENKYVVTDQELRGLMASLAVKHAELAEVQKSEMENTTHQL